MMADQLTSNEENDLSTAFSGVSVKDNDGNLIDDSEPEGSEKQEHGDDEIAIPDEYDDERSLFVGDLARGLTEEQLREPFEPYGVLNVEIKRDRTTGYSLGYGFVTLKTRQDASAAKKGLHRAAVGGRTIRIGWAQKNTNLFIGDLDPTITSDQLREIFRRYGPIYEEETFVKNRNYGFVRFKHRKHAEIAKREMDGKVLGSRPIRIGWGDANYQRHCVHIQFEPAESETLTETEVIAKFEEYGTVMSVNLPRNQGSLRGFGFIYYDDTDSGEASAAKAITSLNNTEICGVRVQCNFGKKPSNKKKKQRGGVKGPRKGSPLGVGPGLSGPPGRGRQQALFPVQVMMPVGPQGTWQPVQYMMTAQQAQQFYNSLQYQHPPQQLSPVASVGGHGPSSPTSRDPTPQPQYVGYDQGMQQHMQPESDGLDDGSGQMHHYSHQMPHQQMYPSSYSSQRQTMQHAPQHHQMHQQSQQPQQQPAQQPQRSMQQPHRYQHQRQQRVYAYLPKQG